MNNNHEASQQSTRPLTNDELWAAYLAMFPVVEYLGKDEALARGHAAIASAAKSE